MPVTALKCLHIMTNSMCSLTPFSSHGSYRIQYWMTSLWLFYHVHLVPKIAGLVTDPATTYKYLSLRSVVVLSLDFSCLLSMRLTDDQWIHGSRGSARKCCVC